MRSRYERWLYHCCTATHVANLMGVDRVELLRAAKVLRGLIALESL